MAELSIKESEDQVVLEGIKYILSQHPSKEKPLQLYFLFAGNAKLERKIIKGVLDNGYTISKVWFIDTDYHMSSPTIDKIIKGLNKFTFYKNNVLNINDFMLMARHNKNLKLQNKIATENMFKISPNQNANVVFLSDIDNLTTLMDNYISINEPISMIAIHSPTIDNSAAEKIGKFYKLFYSKFNKPIGFLWRDPPYIYPVEPHPNASTLSNIEMYKYTRDKQNEIREENRYNYKGTNYIVLTGKRGGKYITVNGKKIYI